MGAVAGGESSFVDESFTVGIAYHYKVVAENQKGVLSNDSNTITVIPGPVPPPPDAVEASARAEAIVLSWKSAGGDICYNIYKTAEKGKYAEGPLNREPVCEGSFRDASLSPARPSYYTVRALRKTDLRDEGYPSREVEVGPSLFVPSPPSDLRIVKGEEKIYLMWKESPEPWVRGYRVSRRIEGQEAFVPLAEVRMPFFTDSGHADKKVWYMIRAVGPEKESGPLVGESR